MNAETHKLANRLTVEGKLEEARELLMTAVNETPAGWTPWTEDEDARRGAFWDMEEFIAYVNRFGQEQRKRLEWVSGSYSQAWYQLAVVAMEEKRADAALFCLDRGLELEADHPMLWCEKGFVLGRLQRHEEALECYVRAAAAREWATNKQMARALRGQGIALIDLGRLEEAEEAIKTSLGFEPESKVAANELNYIAQLRNRQVQQ